MAFRGIGDAATQVIKDQNQQGMEAARLSENARQFDAGSAQRRAQLGESARQFDAGMKQDSAKLAENTRQFDAASGQRQSNMDEQTRQFEAQRADTAAQQNRQYSVEDFKLAMQSRMDESTLASQDVDTQARRAQLNQYLAATEQEQRRRANREKMARGTFFGLVSSSWANGGVSSAEANRIAAQELGAKSVKTVTDMETGDNYFEIVGQDGTVTTKTMPAALAYMGFAEDNGPEAAKPFLDFWSHNATVKARIEAIKAKSAADAATKEDARRDPLKVAEVFRKQAESKLKQAEAIKMSDPAASEDLIKSAGSDTAQATKLASSVIPADMGGGEVAPPFKTESTVFNADERKSLGIPADYSAKTLPPGFVSPSGKVMKNGGVSASFVGLDGKTVTKYLANE